LLLLFGLFLFLFDRCREITPETQTLVQQGSPGVEAVWIWSAAVLLRRFDLAVSCLWSAVAPRQLGKGGKM
jgi:hypothetical protein